MIMNFPRAENDSVSGREDNLLSKSEQDFPQILYMYIDGNKVRFPYVTCLCIIHMPYDMQPNCFASVFFSKRFEEKGKAKRSEISLNKSER